MRGELVRTGNKIDYPNGTPIQAHSTDPECCLGLKVAGTVFKKNPTAEEVAAGVVDIADWLDIVFDTKDADGNSTFVAGAKITFNGNAAQYEFLEDGANRHVIHPNTTQIVANVDVTISGM